MENSTGSAILYYLQRIMFLILTALIIIQINPDWGNQTIFLSSSILIVVFSLLNLISLQSSKDDEIIRKWNAYAILLLIAMIFGTIGDYAMSEILLFPTETSLLNGILFFGVGHIFYLIALRTLSPLLSSGEKRIDLQKFVIWICFIIFVVLAFVMTVYNPDEQVLSIGALGYGVLLISAAAFAVTKWWDDFPAIFKIALVLGFLFFFASDWVIAIDSFQGSTIFDGTSFIGVTYLIGQLLIQSALLLGYWIRKKET